MQSFFIPLHCIHQNQVPEQLNIQKPDKNSLLFFLYLMLFPMAWQKKHEHPNQTKPKNQTNQSIDQSTNQPTKKH